MVYVEIEDLQACLSAAEVLGGKTIIPPTEIPGSGRFALLTDPEGNLLGLWRSKV